jgi:hypothetical protein
MTKEDKILELKELNPYPENIFIPISDEKLKQIIKLMRDNNISTDCLYGNWGREVWNNCAEKAGELFENMYEEEKDFPEIDFRRDIAEELSRDELINRLCEMHKNYVIMRKEWFDKISLPENKVTLKDLQNDDIAREERSTEQIIKDAGKFPHDKISTPFDV